MKKIIVLKYDPGRRSTSGTDVRWVVTSCNLFKKQGWQVAEILATVRTIEQKISFQTIATAEAIAVDILKRLFDSDLGVNQSNYRLHMKAKN